MKDEIDAMVPESDGTGKENKNDSLYFLPWFFPDGVVPDDFETLDELVETLKETVKEIKSSLKELEAMRDGGVTIAEYDPTLESFIFETNNPEIAAKYGFDPG